MVRRKPARGNPAVLAPPPPPAPAQPPAWEAWAVACREWRLLLALAAVAFAVRIPFLARADLWCDEILFVNLSSPPLTPIKVFVGMWNQFLAIGHMPLGAVMHNVLMWLFASFSKDLSHAAFLQRLPAVLWGSLQVPLVYLLARLVASRRAALGAAALMALSTFPVFFSREAYFYAGLMLSATLALLVFVSIVRAGRLTKGAGWLLALTLAFTTLTHINGVTIALAALLIVTLCLLVHRYPTAGPREEVRKLYVRLWPICAAGILPGLPFYWQRVMHPSTQAFQQQPSALEAVHDFLGKTLVGTNLPQGVLGWVLVALALAAILRRDEGRPLRLVLLGLFGVPFAIILFSSMQTLYYARYFNGILALYYIMIALGLEGFADRLSGADAAGWKRRVYPVLLALVLAPQVLLYLPVMYRLPAKGVNYGGIARWLNANLQPGTPYVMESAYELRFTSGFFPTPGLVPAAPYVHGAGAAEMQRLRTAQQSFIERYPEAPFIESARTGTEPGAPFGPWDWPHEFYRHHEDVDNVPLREMAEWGIWPQVPLNRLGDIQYHTPIYFNTPEDIETIARERGDAVLMQFSDWQVRPIQQGVYARVKAGNWGIVTTSNLTDHSVRGHFAMQGAFAAPEQSYDLQVKWMGQMAGSTSRWGGMMWSLETGEVVVPRREGFLEWGIPTEKAKGVQALILQDIRFVPSAGAATTNQ